MIIIIHISIDKREKEMKSTLSQIVCSVKQDNKLGIVLILQLQEVIKKFNVLVHINANTNVNVLKIMAINKDGEVKQQISLLFSNQVETLKSKQRDVYIVFLLAKVIHTIDKKIYDYYTFSHYNENQYINLLIYSLSNSFSRLNSKKNNREVLNDIVKDQWFHTLMLKNLTLNIKIRNIELTLSDDLYRYIGYKFTNKACKGLQTPYEMHNLFDYPFKIAVDNDAVYDYFSIKINDFTVYYTVVTLDMKPYFYVPLHLFEPLSYENQIVDNTISNDNYMLFEYDAFIKFVIYRILKVIEILNSNENLLSPIWIKTQLKYISLINSLQDD